MDKSIIEDILAHAELLLLDLDGTFYPFTPEFDAHTHDVAAEVLMELGIPGTFEELKQKGSDSYYKHGSSFTEFRHTHGLKVQDWHDLYHSKVKESVIKEFHVTASLLAACPIPVALLSHSNRSWIERLFKQFGLSGSISPERIFALEDVGYSYKHEGSEPYRHVLAKLSIAAERAVMVEDSVRNLKTAKEIGMRTVWITHGKPLNTDKYPYVDLAIPILPDFLHMLSQKRIEPGEAAPR